MLFLSGDQDWSAVFRFVRDDYAFYEFLPTPLSKTRATAPSSSTDEIFGRDDDNFVLVSPTSTRRSIGSRSRSRCVPRTNRAHPGEQPNPGTGLDVEGESENVPFTVHLTGRDLGKQQP